MIVPKYIIPKANELGTWILGNGVTDIYYAARVFAVIYVFCVIGEIIANISLMQSDK